MLFVKKLFKLILILFIISTIVFWYAYKVEPYRLVDKRFSVGSNNTSAKAVKLVQFSDVHLGESFSLDRLTGLVEKINEQKPDFVVFTGDMMDKAYEYGHKAAATEILREINARYGKYAVWGNHDYGGGGERYYQSMMKEAGFTLLRNQSIFVKVSPKHFIMFDALDDAFFGKSDLSALKHKSDSTSFHILLLHEPDLVSDLLGYHADLILAGHSHGGQIRLPFLGAIITPPYAVKYKEGIHNLTQGRLYVDTGVGTTHFSARLFNPPQISIFEIGLK